MDFPDRSSETLGYDADGNVLSRKTRKGDTIAFTYDTLNRLASKTAPGEAAVSYGYDLAGSLIGASDTRATIAAPAAAASYSAGTSYDAVNRPLAVNWSPAAAQATPTASGTSFSYGYDPTNRRITQNATDNSWWSYPTTAGTTGYTANNLNQYSAVGAVSPTGACPRAGRRRDPGDGNGNLVYDGVFTYGYDAENRLVSVKQGGTTVASYAYNAQGRRKLKTVGSASTVYVTDADNREALEYDGASGALGRWYAFGQGPDAVLGQMNVAASTRKTMIPDIQGSIIGTLDSGTGVLAKSGYQPFGENPSVTTGTYRYTARRFDPETAGSASQPSGLYYYRARMYSPTWGRFLQPDPIGYTAGSNLYAYVNNDPLNLTDPSGKDPFIGATVGFIAGAYYGALGAASTPGATWKSVLVGAGVGGAVGAGVGALDPSLGVYTLAVVGGVAGGAGDIAGQVITNALAGNSLGNINYGSTAGAVIGGALGGAGGTVLGGLAAKAGISELAGTAMGASISSGPGTLLPAVGGAISDYLTGGMEGTPSTTTNPGAISQGSVPLGLSGATATGQSMK